MDFDHVEEGSVLTPEMEAALPSEAQGGEDVEQLLQRYHAEKNTSNRRNLARRLKGSLEAMANGAAVTSQETRSFAEAAASTGHGAGSGPALSTGHLPPLGGGTIALEAEKLRAENAELRQMVAELRQVLEANDPQAWEQHHQEQQRLLAQRDEEITALRAYCEEWNQKAQTHRLVPADDDLAQMADELEKDRCQTAQDKRQLDEDKRQLKEDEESLMKQMREMEVSMARDRAELARQRTELHRLQSDIRHELELLQRGDVAVKERLAAFQRRSQDAVSRPAAPPPPTAALAPPTPPTSAPTSSPAIQKPKDSTVFKRLFGQG